jgi:2-polyprenyl-3-methyl-5-hydroxy-6-metoxy-1,4-benzoquinol methylase
MKPAVDTTERGKGVSHVERAFREYDHRTDLLDVSPDAKQRWFDALAESTYLPVLGPPESCRVLDVGCNRGYLLHALQRRGFAHLAGVDLAPRDLEEARKTTGLDTLYCEDAVEFLERHRGSFDAVIFKAVLEHFPRDRVDAFVSAVVGALAPSGVALCEVPNMDWYAASHERYMDLTHEVGYTRESLEQLFGLFFESVEVRRVIDPAHDALASPVRKLARKIVFGLARRMLHLMGEDTATFWFDARSILAIARQPRP